MKTIRIMLIAALIAMVMSGCGGTDSTQNFGSAVNTNTETSRNLQTLTFKLGDNPNNEMQSRSVSYTMDDILDLTTEMCLEVRDENFIFYSKVCSPVIEGKYPELSIDLPKGEFAAILLAKHVGDTIGHSNLQLVQVRDISKDKRTIYMGGITKVYSVEIYFDIYDSTKEIDFSKYTQISLVNESYVTTKYVSNEYDYISQSKDYILTSFYIEKNIDYQFICLNSDCRYLSDDLDLLNNSSIDFSKLKKVVMKDVKVDSVCSISYDQYFATEININNKYNWSDNYLTISDCNQSVNIKVILQNYYELSLKTNYKDDFVDIDEDSYSIKTNINDIKEKKYFSFSYHPNENTPLDKVFSPAMQVIITHPKTGEVLQHESFNVTNFSFYDEEEDDESLDDILKQLE